MSGRFLFDTNAVINAINSKCRCGEGEYLLSVISEIELFSFPKLRDHERNELRRLLSHFDIVPVDDRIKEETILIRLRYGLKIPDAIICATAKVESCLLITDDRAFFRVDEVQVTDLKGFIDLQKSNFCK
ncbi:type II toxin-antitoxin system VapC family toxin [Nitratifractor sp.]